MSKKTTPNTFDATLQKLAGQSPAVHLACAVLLTVSSYALITQGSKLSGLFAGFGALLFSLMGLNGVFRDMKLLRLVEAESTLARLQNIHLREAEIYIKALFRLSSYTIRCPKDELEKHEDAADLIATRKGETILIKLDCWDDDVVKRSDLENLRRAASHLRTDRCMAITQGTFHADTAEWAKRKGVELVTPRELLQLAAPLIGVDADSLANPAPSAELLAEMQHEIGEVAHGHHRYLFVDFAGLSSAGYSRLTELLLGHPGYQLVAAPLPDGHTLDSLRSALANCGHRLVAELPQSTAGKYFAVMQFLSSQPLGRKTPWLALDSNPRAYPEGTEFVAVNPIFGFDSGTSARLVEAMLRVDRTATIA